MGAVKNLNIEEQEEKYGYKKDTQDYIQLMEEQYDVGEEPVDHFEETIAHRELNSGCI